ncbi:MAG: hypothetical protein WAW36_07215 [Methylovulum miyakonense]
MITIYKIIKYVTFCLLFIFLPASIYVVWTTTQSAINMRVATKLFNFILGSPLLVIFIGILHTIFAKEQKLEIFAAWILAIIVSAIAVYFFFGFAQDCGVTSEVLAELKKRFPPKN